MSRRRSGSKRPFAPGAGQDAGRSRQGPEPVERHEFSGRQNTGGQLHKKGRGKRKQSPEFVRAIASPRGPKAPVINAAEVDSFTAAAAHRGAPSLTAQRERLIELGLIKKGVVNV